MRQLLNCLRCNWQWMTQSTTQGLPRHCPKCKSPYWNKPVQRINVSVGRKKKVSKK